MPRGFSGSMADSRVCISRAALLVKVTAMILAAMARWLAISQAMRVVSTRVLPLPAPASTSAEPAPSVTARNCSGFKPAR